MKKVLTIILVIILALNPCIFSSAVWENSKNSIRLVVPNDWEMDIGDSRSVECVFSDKITNRLLTWSTNPEDIASVDQWGRVTALKAGKVTVTATTSDGLTSSAVLNVVDEPTKSLINKAKNDYNGKAASENDVLQKVVTRYKLNDRNVPENVKDASVYADMQKVITNDGAVWEITNYGVLRTDKNASDKRDMEMHLMGDRYFYNSDTTDGKVLAIFGDGENGIWTVMANGYTHISMEKINGTDKASLMSATTQKYVSRRGMVNSAYLEGGKWATHDSDNDGLWTAMYGAGELMRYAVLRDDPNATPEEIEAARKAACLSTEAVLMLTYISMRTGTVESYVRAQQNGNISDIDKGTWYSAEALEDGGDYSSFIPGNSPADAFASMRNKYMLFGIRSYTMRDNNLKLLSPESWSNPTENSEKVYARRTRLLEGFWARTYSLKEENNGTSGYIYWSVNDDKTATGVSTRATDRHGYLLNNENLRGVKVDASGSIPDRLWNDLIGSGYDIDDIIYKGDTSADEVIGHLFIYKLAYDILGEEDPEIAYLISNTMDKFAQHLVDNGYSLCDGSGQPTTWGKFGRTYLHNGQVMGGAPLQTAVVLSVFKLAAYVTGDKKWEDEYKMAALDPAYEYAKIVAQEKERYQIAMLEYGNSVSPVLGFVLRPFVNTKLFKMLYRFVLNYSDEEMAMLAYYLLFQLENDETLLSYYRDGLEDWWYSMSFSENPLWYYIYQLAYPDEAKKDYYGNNLLETAAWSLSRHPMETIRYLASNSNRDDIAALSLDDFGIEDTEPLTYDPNVRTPLFASDENTTMRIIGAALSGPYLKWKVAPPDERAIHRFNNSTYILGDRSEATVDENCTTYTLPYWMGRYHGMIK